MVWMFLNMIDNFFFYTSSKCLRKNVIGFNIYEIKIFQAE